MEVTTTTTESQQPTAAVSIDWYTEGQSRAVAVDGVEITVRLIGRKGRRSRIAITAPPGATFESPDRRDD